MSEMTYSDTTLRQIHNGRIGTPSTYALHGLQAFDQSVAEAVELLESSEPLHRAELLRDLMPMFNADEQEVLIEHAEGLYWRDPRNDVPLTPEKLAALKSSGPTDRYWMVLRREYHD